VARVCYIDAGIRDNAGHHTNACRHFVSELRKRGITVQPFGNQSVDTRICRELQVEPLFRHFPYNRLRGGRYVSYLIERSSFLFDLKSVWGRGPFDLVFVHSVMAAQLSAIALWLRDFDPAKMPFVVIGFDLPSGRRIIGGSGASEARLRWNYHTQFFPKAGTLFRPEYLPRIVFFAFDPVISNDYAELLKLPVQTMPSVHLGIGEPRLRKRDRSGLINVAFLGYQRPEKGSNLLPDIIRDVLERQLPVKLLIHNSAPGDGPIRQELRVLASVNRNILLIEEPGDQVHWQGLLEKADLVVLPYEPSRYRESGSGIATEAVSSGIPMVVPRGTTMETLAVHYQGVATTFSHWGAKEVADAIEKAVFEFDILAKKAEAGALVWRRKNGVELFVDRMLEFDPFDNCVSDASAARQSSYNFMLGRLLDGLVSRLT
jgi:glycosyltransferase involved in cell wall biosynthesis